MGIVCEKGLGGGALLGISGADSVLFSLLAKSYTRGFGHFGFDGDGIHICKALVGWIALA